MATNIAKNWSIAKIWEDSFQIKPRIIESRDYLYGSEIGGSWIDTFYKMKGIPATNTPTGNALRKMQSGLVWESVVLMVLKRAGILKKAQHKVDFQLAGLLPVHGRLDMMAGGEVDAKQSEEFAAGLRFMFDVMEFPPIYLDIANRAMNMVEGMKEGAKYAHLKEMVIEVKSVSSYVWDMVEASGKPAGYHKLQLFHYLYGLEMPEGRVYYINRDDCRLKEIPVYNDRETFSEYSGWIEKMTDYWNSGKEPPKEPLISFDSYAWKFRKSTMAVEWSPYLTLIYGYNSPNDFREHVSPIVDQMNRVFKRCVDGAKMTPKNLDVIARAKEFFPEWELMVDRGKAANVVLTEAEEISE